MDVRSPVVQKPVLNLKHDGFTDARSFLANPAPAFAGVTTVAYAAQSFLGGWDNLARGHLAVNEDETSRTSATTDVKPQAFDEPVTAGEDPNLDEAPPVYGDESFGDADDEVFVAEDSFEAADGATVYVSQPDDAEELEALLVA